ncbi:hypothetical protein BXO88_14190 [Oribacterium sp. C9]|uniref:PucR family transcriptional regulator n=1 Tax=Oribacterium sp. C9 TaxID=1943579 RepID=UPI00098EE56D|nr:helix-turn-helix domain-containing protein [Oribacterium sp. C9]OON85064.1 hypothetical protein BXO88_14190 [Oribacterium sp. C9]
MEKHELFEIIVRSKTIQEFVDACGKKINDPFWIMDGAYRIIAQSHSPSSEKYLEDFNDGKTMERVDRWVDSGLLNKVSGNPKPVRLRDAFYDEDIVIMDVFSDRRPIGKLTIVLHEQLTDDEVIGISNAVAIYLRAQNPTSGSTLEQGLALLLQDTAEAESTGRKILKSAGYAGKPPYSLLIVDTEAKGRTAILNAFMADLRNTDPMIICGIISNRGYILVCDGHEIPKRLLKKNIRVGYSLPFENLQFVNTYALQAEMALRLGQEQEEHFEDHYGDYIRECIGSDMNHAEAFIMPEIRHVIDYDNAYKTEYFETLKCYLHLMCSKQKTADEMGIHLNTVKYRISQLEKIFGIDFSKVDAIFVSLMATELYRRRRG